MQWMNECQCEATYRLNLGNWLAIMWSLKRSAAKNADNKTNMFLTVFLEAIANFFVFATRDIITFKFSGFELTLFSWKTKHRMQWLNGNNAKHKAVYWCLLSYFVRRLSSTNQLMNGTYYKSSQWLFFAEESQPRERCTQN